MHLLLLSATDTEISETASWLSNHTLGLNALKPKLLIGGIGQLQTAYALQNRIRLERPGLVIQAGIGGSSAKDDLGMVHCVLNAAGETQPTRRDVPVNYFFKPRFINWYLAGLQLFDLLRVVIDANHVIANV